MDRFSIAHVRDQSVAVVRLTDVETDANTFAPSLGAAIENLPRQRQPDGQRVQSGENERRRSIGTFDFGAPHSASRATSLNR
jgi:hypothetical protein